MSNWLDPKRHPVKTGLFIQVIGGLTAVFFAFVASKLNVEEFFRTSIVVYWWLFVFITTIAALAVALQIKGWIFAKASKRIVIVIPALAQNHWFADLIQETFKQLHRQRYDVVLKIPYEDFSKNDQTWIFQHLERHPGAYIGGIIIPYKHESIRKELAELCNKISYPVIFADVRPFDAESDYPRNTAFVGYDERKIGILAARRVAKYLQESRIDKPLVEVIGCAHSQTGRQDAFCEGLKKLVPGVIFGPKRDGEFRRSKAKDIAVSFFDESVKREQYIDAIFCTNDEMALGVYDAMLSVETFGIKPPFLIGVDGAKGAVRLIRDKDAYFNATVKQPTKNLALNIATLLTHKINKEFCPTESFLEPEMYDKEIAQAEHIPQP